MNFARVAGLNGFFALCVALQALATDPLPPVISSVNVSNTTKNLRFAPYPGAQSYTFYSASNVAGPFVVNTNFVLSPYITGYITNMISNQPVVLTNLSYEWRQTNVTAPDGFYKMSATGLNSNALLTATVLNRLAYGPTPDELERVTAIGPQAYIAEQLAMDGIPESLDNYVIEVTNTVSYNPATNWTYVQVTGSQSSTNLLMYLTQAGDAYVDDIQLVVGTNAGVGPNLINNGDFESALTPPWNVSANHSGSAIVAGPAHSGANSLHIVATSPGSSSGSGLSSAIWQAFIPTQTNGSNSKLTLSFWVLPGPYSSKLTFRLQTINSTSLLGSAAGVPASPRWFYATSTGTASSVSRLYFYLSTAGQCYLDDVKLVAGSVPESGANLVVNGDFESALGGEWVFGSRYTASAISSTIAHSGNGSLQIIGSNTGSTNNGIYQTNSLVNGQTYTLSYWYYPITPGATITAKLFGNSSSNLLSNPDTDSGGLARRLNTGLANVSDLRAWFCLHAVNSPRQLLEVLSQFWENHFVTQWLKSRDYFNNKGYDGAVADYLAADWEFREMNKWRNAMLNPNCTFYDLLKISAESPAMIVYLDTVDSKGNNNNIANENYARELFELFTFGVDNGYDQNDIVLMSRAWTGWSVELVDPQNATNVFAPASLTYYPNTNGNTKPNTIGVWAFNYKTNNHGTNRGAIFGGKTVPARFGSPWAGMNYQLTIPPRTGTNGILDGYDVITNLANLPFTSEYISVKLCRLFVHDDFPNPTTKTGTVEYAFYDYTDPNRSPEAELVRQCMLTWENSTPKGNLRAVLNTIFSSDLFRSHTASAQKIKTPFEFVASSVRSMLSTNSNGQLTAGTDGYSFTSQLDRMGTMSLFNRDAPDGYPEAGPPWISAGTLAERIRYVQALCMTNGASGRDDAGKNFVDPVGVLKGKPGNWTDAGNVADYFLGILFPAEGAANLAPYRAACIKYLDTNDDGTSSLFSGLGNTSSAYENRVRGMVAMLLTSKRFHEQ